MTVVYDDRGDEATGQVPVTTIKFTINGHRKVAEVEPRLLLADLIRSGTGLTGTHRGCDTTNCGACTVLVDGTPVKSCTMLAVQADGREVTTVEGLGGEGEHGVVAAAGPGFLVAGGQERVGLVRGQVGDVGAVAALAGDGQDPLDQRPVLGMAQGGIAEEGVDRGQAGVAGPDAVAPVILQVLQERGDHRGVEVGKAERARRFP